MELATVRYWAALKDAAGTPDDRVDPAPLDAVLKGVVARHGERFERVLSVCSLVVDGEPVGTRDRATVEVLGGSLVDCLPPFAGG